MFSIYDTPQLITEPISTNSFSYNERKTLLGHTPQITITPRKIGGFDDVQLGSHTVIEEIDHKGTLQSRTGLQHNIYIDRPTPIAIMDNHNHALGIWREVMSNSTNSTNKPTVIHIDAHADLEPATEPFPTNLTEDQIRDYVHSQTHIGSFIQPALESRLISDCIQIRSYYALEELATRNWSLDTTIILDIDLDFRLDQKKIPQHHLAVIKDIIRSYSISCITIATSPYFLDQKKFIDFLQQLKPILQSTS